MIENDIYSLKNFIAVLFSLILLLFIGMVGYMFIEGWSWHDALYMTFITFSTVGYGEVGPLHWGGRLFSMLIILTGLIILALLSANATSFLLRREFLTTYRIRKMKKNIEKLSGHTILCGAGETGKTVINEFIKTRKPLVVIEESPEAIKIAKEAHPGLRIIAGDATKDETLTEANIDRASGLITALSEDTANLFVVISARSLKPDLAIVARAVDPHTASKMYKAGATHVISPNLTEGMRMAATVLRPTVISFLDIMAKDDDLGLRLEEFTVKPGASFIGKSLKELEIPSRTGLIVLGVKKRDKFTFNPQSTTRIDQNDVMIILGDSEKMGKLQKLSRR